VLNAQYDFIIIGSGFGGSVAAMRLTQKGYRVAVIEKGRRYFAKDFAETNWDLKRFLWAPLLKCFGIQQITLLKGIMLFHGAGVGGGSLVYANTLMKPADEVLLSSAWPAGRNWLQELNPHFEMARRMLGVNENKIHSEAEDLLLKLSKEMKVEDSFHKTEVAVYFGEAGVTKPDPYFAGAGPSRTGCIACGACMVGCRHNAKNTLDKNYLFFAEKWGAEIFPELKVTKITPLNSGNTSGGYSVTARSVNKYFGGRKVLTANKVILASGVIGSLELLFKNRDIYKTLPEISPALGETIRTNGESLCGVTAFDDKKDLSKGIAIGSAIHPDSVTKIEAVRYNSGSNLMKWLAVPVTPNGSKLTRPFKLVKKLVSEFGHVTKLFKVKDWARQTVILLVMQTVDIQMKMKLGRSLLTLGRKSLVGSGEFPSYLEVAQTATHKLAKIMNGEGQNASSEVLLGIPSTAHILGGCNLGSVVDENHQVNGHPGLYVCDGSVIPANLGVNPSLTITALAERFTEQFEIKNESLFSERRITFS
jgi:cholesterol oxidase